LQTHLYWLYLQVEIYCNTKGLSIVGYYHANERMDDLRWAYRLKLSTSLSRGHYVCALLIALSCADTAQCIAAKVASNSEKACLLMVRLKIPTVAPRSSTVILLSFSGGQSDHFWRTTRTEGIFGITFFTLSWWLNVLYFVSCTQRWSLAPTGKSRMHRMWL